MEHKRIKRISSHVGLSRYLATIGDPIGFIPRDKTIPSPYAYSPDHVVYGLHDNRAVFVVETAHKQYDVFECTGESISLVELA